MVERDPYAVLGVAAEAGEAEIHDAYRRLAKRYHPDLNADPRAEGRFKEIAAAYDALSRKEKRSRRDRGAAPGRQRRRDTPASKGRGQPRLGLGGAALVCLLLASVAIIFAWTGAAGRMTRWSEFAIPGVAAFFLLVAAALFVIRTVGRVLSPGE